MIFWKGTNKNQIYIRYYSSYKPNQTNLSYIQRKYLNKNHLTYLPCYMTMITIKYNYQALLLLFSFDMQVN